jgi:hypothetical protein
LQIKWDLKKIVTTDMKKPSALPGKNTIECPVK